MAPFCPESVVDLNLCIYPVNDYVQDSIWSLPVKEVTDVVVVDLDFAGDVEVRHNVGWISVGVMGEAR